MAIGRNGAAARHLSALFHAGASGTLTDGQLLERFATRTGEAAELAFAALVERHGPLVLRVCRSILRDDHAAHDAAQATFLVLVEKSGSLWVCDSLAPWLHAVAYRVALRARGSAARRRRHEHARALASVAATSDPVAEARELAEVLHEEIESLPERYRVPIVLCDLEGRSHDEAARHLGWPVGTVKSRQARGRDRLRARLSRRGVAPASGVMVGAILKAEAEGAQASPQLAREMAAVAARVTAKGMGAASAPAASLAKEVLMSMLIGKLKWAGLALLTLTLAATGALAIPSGIEPVRPPLAFPSRTALVEDEVPRDRVGKIYLSADSNDGGMMVLDPRTGEASRVLLECRNRPRVSPDGRRVAYEWDGALWVRDVEKGEPTKVMDLDPSEFGRPTVWSADGSKLVVSLGRKNDAFDGKNGHFRFKTLRINVDGTGREDLNVPAEDQVDDCSPDGLLLTNSSRNAEIGWQLYVMKPDGSELRQITEGGNPFFARFSPDGKRVAYADGSTEELRGIWVVGLDGKDRRKVLSAPGARLWSPCWSPDGKRIAVLIVDDAEAGGVLKARLVLQDVDGDGRTEFAIDDVRLSDSPDWR